QAIVTLQAPGGRRIEAPAAPLKAIVGAMLDVLLAPRRRVGGPLQLNDWQAERAEGLRQSLSETQAERAGLFGQWQLQGESGLQALVQRLRGAGLPPEVSAPPGLQLQLRGYQLQGLAWLQYLREHHLAGILADEMGLGKTAQVLAHLLLEKDAGRLDLPALVVLPTTLVANWRAEAARQAGDLRVLALQGSQRRRDFPRIREHDLVLTTYALLPRDLDALKQQPWHLVVLDEAQFAKNAGSRAASAARRLPARHRLALSGTPVENNLSELWAHFDLLMPGFLGDWRSFNRLWRRPIEDNGEQQRAELLARRVRPFILRRRKEDVAADLPTRSEVIRRVQLQGAQRALYESVRIAADEHVRRIIKDATLWSASDHTPAQGAQIAVLDALLKLRQVCCDPRLLKNTALPANIESAKLELLAEMLPALLSQGRRVLVFSQFTALLALVQAQLVELQLPHLLLTGATPAAKRSERIAQFQAGDTPLLLASLKAGGVGLNLTAADTVIHLDPWWNPAVQEQASARAHRIGQTRPVFIYKLVVEGSIEERMLALQARKAALAESVLGGGGPIKFNVRELHDLLAKLSPPS
ncbi:MAG TPA: DEAD/DEAH box helicase, partial [Rubrivivax sp.]|nr:DEAD/DEAH box helicase [Rubrivivax sp.]